MNKKIEEALIDQIGQCYQAFIQIYQTEHPLASNNWKTQINLKRIDDIVRKALQDLLQSSNGIGAGCFSHLGVSKRVIQRFLETPIVLDINQISNPSSCLNHLMTQAPLQTRNIQHLIFTTEELFQKRSEQGVDENCNDEVHDFVIQKIRSMILESR
jgi:preprotein translocase subunit SecD